MLLFAHSYLCAIFPYPANAATTYHKTRKFVLSKLVTKLYHEKKHCQSKLLRDLSEILLILW